jgi:hypothetical protein
MSSTIIKRLWNPAKDKITGITSLSCVFCGHYGNCPVNRDPNGKANFIQSNGLKGVECTLYEAAYITPEQYKERTGKDWQDKAAVYAPYTTIDGTVEWHCESYDYAKHKKYKGKVKDPKSLVCATEIGCPPDNWEPGKGAF